MKSVRRDDSPHTASEQSSAACARSSTTEFTFFDGVVVATSPANTEPEDFGDWHTALVRGSEGDPPYVVWDVRQGTSVSRSQRPPMFEELAALIGGIAMVAGTPIPAPTVNVFLLMQQIPIPIALFSSEEAALAWAQNQRRISHVHDPV